MAKLALDVNKRILRQQPISNSPSTLSIKQRTVLACRQKLNAQPPKLNRGGVINSFKSRPDGKRIHMEYTPEEDQSEDHSICNKFDQTFIFNCSTVPSSEVKRSTIAQVKKTSHTASSEPPSFTVSLTPISKDNLHTYSLTDLYPPKSHTFISTQLHNPHSALKESFYYYADGDYFLATISNPDGSEVSIFEQQFHVTDSILYSNPRNSVANKNKVFVLQFSKFKEIFLAYSHNSPISTIDVDFETFVLPQEATYITPTQRGLIIETVDDDNPPARHVTLEFSYMFLDVNTKILTEFNNTLEITFGAEGWSYPFLKGKNDYFQIDDTFFPISDAFSTLPFLPKPAESGKDFLFFDGIRDFGRTRILNGLYGDNKPGFVKLAIRPDTYSICSSNPPLSFTPGSDPFSFYDPRTQSIYRFQEDIDPILFPFLVHTEPTEQIKKDLPELGGLATILIVLVLCLCGAGVYHKNRKSNVLPVQSEPPQQGQEQFIELTTVNVNTDTYENNNSIRNPRNNNHNKMSKTTQKSNKIPANKKYEV